ncbi:hypothetical protein, partial [Klebsiella pneumoniae]|uniref:hypothetical protein n=1 Tax=Klebsiella pneumoniae TaxID=573 RepID=UPI0038537AB5
GEMWWHIRMQPINALHLFASVLYNSQDKKHPTELGTYISALVVAKRIAGHAMVTPHFVPPAMTLRQAAYLNDMTSGAVQVSEHH